MSKPNYEGDQTPIERLRNLLSPVLNLVELLNLQKNGNYFENETMNNIFLKNLEVCTENNFLIKEYLGDIENFYENNSSEKALLDEVNDYEDIMEIQQELIAVYEKYIGKLGEELKELIVIAAKEGWQSKRLKESAKIRNEIIKIKQKLKRETDPFNFHEPLQDWIDNHPEVIKLHENVGKMNFISQKEKSETIKTLCDENNVIYFDFMFYSKYVDTGIIDK